MFMEKAIARHELTCELQDVVCAADHLLVPRGALFMVYPASRFGELTSVLRLHRMEPRTVRCVHPLADRPAKRVLLHAVKAGRADVTVLPLLVLHGDDEHAFTDEVNAISRLVPSCSSPFRTFLRHTYNMAKPVAFGQ
ncbi:hypothetical protein [Myxococcus xanthus]|uniref:hypothetical protein n=1 Tax=Myxococcus xanthus TaxID=34 RepID=UPI001CED9E07|nr:hypothetical protein [Myxococcus xanthus]